MGNFIYVFDQEGKEKLMSMGYELLKSNEEKGIHVFINKDRLDFALASSPYVVTDTLTF